MLECNIFSVIIHDQQDNIFYGSRSNLPLLGLGNKERDKRKVFVLRNTIAGHSLFTQESDTCKRSVDSS